jgi:hypothetical protein
MSVDTLSGGLASAPSWLHFVTRFITVEESVSKSKRPRCAYCKAPLPKATRGRRPNYCKASHRQRAYEMRRAAARAPQVLMQRDIGNALSEALIIRTLKKLGVLPPEPPPRPKLPAKPRLRVVK